MIGGGVSGLSAAYRIIKLRPQSTVCVLEAGMQLGGKLVSEEQDGFIVEAGPDGFLTRKSIVLELAEELGLSADLIRPHPDHRFSHILSDGQLRRMPDGFSGLVPGNIASLRGSGIVSPEGSERADAERTIPLSMHTEEETVAEFFCRRLGIETFEKLIEPLVSGIYAGDPRCLSIHAAFPQLVAIEKEGKTLLDSVESAQKLASGPPPPAFASFAAGMGAMPVALAKALATAGVILAANTEALAVSRGADGNFLVATQEGELAARTVVIALSPSAAARVLRPSFSTVAGILSEITMASTSQLSVAFSAGHALSLPPGSGFVVPFRERVSGECLFSGATWSSQKWPSRAPTGALLLRFYYGGIREPLVWQTSDDSLLKSALSFLARYHGGVPPVPLWHQVFRWKDAIPQLNIGHRALLSRLEAVQALNPGLMLAGAYFKGVGVPDSIDSAFSAARAVVAFLD